ncbi:MAG: tRNA (adenosine(37)-N6)-dimethylallyltransferase MiaA [Actinomycetaceae bacterium]|nr:tRNA (adenosine(37)-N6)-dimethylallyltransferase MiaA [Actinomycetaceae bacterium]
MIIAVVGPTATGKSDLGLDLGQRLTQAGHIAGFEVISADAMQLYRGMDIGTAKLPLHERRGIPHHQIDVLNIDEEASVAAYQEHARRNIRDIQVRGLTPVVIGGSGLYLRALLDQMDFPGVDPDVRQALETQAEQLGGLALYNRLETLDPQAAEKIQPANTRRIIRALEVIELTGRPFSATLPTYTYALENVIQIGIAMPIDILDGRINTRAQAMIDQGLIEEVEGLIQSGHQFGRTAARATGYSQALDVLRGALGKEEAGEAIALATRRLARKQQKWFKRDPRIRWLQWDGAPGLVEAAQEFLADK